MGLRRGWHDSFRLQANHRNIFSMVGFEVEEYPYWNPQTRGLDYEGMIKAITTAPEGSIFIIHPCAHNPTGVDPTQEQWKGIAEAMRAKGHFTFFDCAYQGFASGDLDRDAWAVRYFVEQGFELFVAQSFAKNFGLYGKFKESPPPLPSNAVLFIGFLF